MLATMAWWKWLSMDAGNLMFLCVRRVMNHPINPRVWNFFPGFELISY